MTDTRNDLPSISAPNFEQRVRETLMTYMGRQGDPLDRGLTLRDLIESGLVSLKDGVKLVSGRGTIPLVSGPNATSNTVPDLTPPPTPTGFKLAAAISHVFIEHDDPKFVQGHGYLRTVVYGKVREVGDDAPLFANAVKLTEFSGMVHAMPSNPATTWHLWIKWQTNDGVLSVDPAGGTHGLEVTTGQDVAKLLEALQGQITASQLYSELGSKIDLIDAPESVQGSVAARVAAEAKARTDALLEQANTLGSAISRESSARQTDVDSLARNITTLTASVNNGDAALAAAIQAEESARVSALTVEAQKRELLAAAVNNPQTGLSATRATLINDYYTAADANQAITNKLTELENKVYSPTTGAVVVSAHLRNNFYTKTDADSAISKAVTTAQATLNGKIASVEQGLSANASTTQSLAAQYYLKLDVNGKISGFGLHSSQTISEFAVRADRFYVASGSSNYLPFAIQTGPTVINGVSVPAGVYIEDAFIKNGTITNAKIANAAIDNAKIANLSADKLTAGDGTIGGVLKSATFTSTSGWQITRDGNATFNNAVVRGTVHANAGTIGGNTITATGIESSNWSSGEGFKLNANGSVRFGSASSFLSYDAPTKKLTYKGSIDVRGTAASRMEITDEYIKVFENGVLRVQIGNLAL